jgi:hypothetical protein
MSRKVIKGKMKIIVKAIIPLFLVVKSTACNSFVSTPMISPTDMIETSITAAWPEVVETQTADPTLGPSIIQFLATPLLTTTPLPSTQATSLPISMIPTTVAMENGLEWTECVVPPGAYARSKADTEFLAKCAEIPTWDENDKKRIGERVSGREGGSDLRITIGNDYYETKHDNSKELWTYELMKNGEAILKINPSFMAYDPNRNFWNIEGKLVWELAGYAAMIVVDGVNFNEKYQLEGSFFPYEINGKLIYIAKKNGEYHIVYDEKVMGPEFDQIYMAYCCGMISVYYGQDQYWFVGRREGTYFVVVIR